MNLTIKHHKSAAEPVIFIIEDERIFHRLVLKSVEEIGVDRSNIYSAYSLDGIYDLFKQELDPSLIILDLNLDDITGNDTLRIVRKLFQNAHIIILSSANLDLIKDFKDSKDGFISKNNYSPQQFRLKVRDLVERLDQQNHDLRGALIRVMDANPFPTFLLNQESQIVYFNDSSKSFYALNSAETIFFKQIEVFSDFKSDGRYTATHITTEGVLKNVVVESNSLKFDDQVFQLIVIQPKYEDGQDYWLSHTETMLNQVSMELHDNISPYFIASQFYLKTLIDKKDISENNRFLLSKSIQNIQEGLELVKLLSYNTNNLTTQEGLIPFLTSYFDQLQGIKGIKFELTYSSSLESETPEFVDNSQLIPIVKEFVINAIKYSNATLVEVIVSYDGDSFEMKLRDNGIGFDMEKARKGAGLKNILMRIQQMNASYVFDSKSGDGVRLDLRVKKQR
jgi:DNA-binding response OmpR family regulator